jgi:hypothetical protein
MAITSADIVKRYSVTAGAGDTTVGTAATSLGDQISQTAIPDDQFGNVFGDIASEDALEGVVRYRCIFILNNHGSLTLVGPEVSIQSQTPSGATIAFGVDPTAKSPKGQASLQAVQIANQTTAPAGVTFGTTPVGLSDLAPGECRAVWVRQTVPAATGSMAEDNFVLLIDGDTLP